jgi:hypothetical protein
MTRSGGAWESAMGNELTRLPPESKLTCISAVDKVPSERCAESRPAGEGPLAGKTLLECSFLIPIRRDKQLSDGKSHKPRAWKWLEVRLEEFGGATRATALYSGWYRDPETGARVSDLSRQYVVAVPRPRLDKLRTLLREACEVFRQKCIYLSIAGKVEFVEGSVREDE